MYVALKDADAFFANLPVELQTAAVRGLHSSALRLQSVITTVLIPSRTPQPVDRGVYRAGWRTVLEADGATVENLEPHALFIEEGVRAENVKPGRAMLNALKEWVIRKGLAAPTGIGGTRISDQEAPVMRIVWAIVNAQRKRGIFGHGNGLGIVRELVDVWVEIVVQEEILREIDELFE